MNLAGALNLSLIVIVLTLLLVTGLTALVVAAFVLLSLFLAPLAQTVPLYATAPALIFVACLMAASLGAIKWDDATEYIPALITALLMPLSYSIATGIGLGFIAYVMLEGICRALSRNQCRGCSHCRGLPAQADLRLTGGLHRPCKTLSRSL